MKMKKILTLFFLTHFIMINAQEEIIGSFEYFDLALDSFLNGSNGESQFNEIGINLPVNYDTTFQSWTGWAISSATDTITSGFANQYSSIPGEGVDGSKHYAVSYHYLPNELYFESLPLGSPQNISLKGCYITNATYPFLSMKEGDAFAKKFGGADGNDQDFFSVTIKGFNESDQLIDSVVFYLADFRFEDNSLDYIIDKWTFVDLSALDGFSKMTFTMNSSDVGMFGINTPTYFCIDNWTYEVNQSSSADDISSEISCYPNPVRSSFHISLAKAKTAYIYDVKGQMVVKKHIDNDSFVLETKLLAPGLYTLVVQNADGNLGSRRFVKD